MRDSIVINRLPQAFKVIKEMKLDGIKVNETIEKLDANP